MRHFSLVRAATVATVGLLVLALAPSAFAQFAITPGGANAGNGWFFLGAPGTSGTGAGNQSATFTSGTSATTDNLFQDQWWFRGPGDTREFAFVNQPAGTPAQTMVTVGTTAGTTSTGGYDSTVTAASYSLAAQFRWTITAGSLGPTVSYSAVFTNTGATAYDISLFSYKDFDVNGTSGANTYSYNSSTNTFTVASGPATVTWTSASTPSAFQSTVFSTLLTSLDNTTVTNLDNTVTGSPGDFTGAFQYNLTLAPGQPVTLSGTFGVAVPEPASLGLLGLAATGLVRRRRR